MVLTYPVPDMTTDDAAVDAERTGRLADSHTEIDSERMVAQVEPVWPKTLVSLLLRKSKGIRTAFAQTLTATTIESNKNEL